MASILPKLQQETSYEVCFPKDIRHISGPFNIIIGDLRKKVAKYLEVDLASLQLRIAHAHWLLDDNSTWNHPRHSSGKPLFFVLKKVEAIFIDSTPTTDVSLPRIGIGISPSDERKA